MNNIKEEYRNKIDMLDKELEMIEELTKFNKKTTKIIWFIGGFLLLFITIFNIISKKEVNTIDVITISLLVSTLHRSVFDYVIQYREYEHKLTMARLNRDYLVKLLDKLEVNNSNDL